MLILFFYIKEIFMKKALLVLVTLCVATAFSCASGGSTLTAPERTRPVLPGEITGNLGDYTATNNATQKGWCSNGTDGTLTDLDVADIIGAKFLVLKLKSKPIGGLQVIWQGDGNGWAWDQMDGVLSNDGVPDASKGAVLSGDNVLTIELSKALKNYNKLAGSTQAKIYLGYYSNTVADLGVFEADLVK
jgi:hypothetical protein